MKLTWKMFLLTSMILFVTACAGPNPLQDAAVPISEVSGFWAGIWHGLTFPVSLLASLVTDYISIYAVQNTGGGYDVGYGLGLFLLLIVIVVVNTED